MPRHLYRDVASDGLPKSLEEKDLTATAAQPHGHMHYKEFTSETLYAGNQAVAVNMYP